MIDKRHENDMLLEKASEEQPQKIDHPLLFTSTWEPAAD